MTALLCPLQAGSWPGWLLLLLHRPSCPSALGQRSLPLWGGKCSSPVCWGGCTGSPAIRTPPSQPLTHHGHAGELDGRAAWGHQ